MIPDPDFHCLAGHTLDHESVVPSGPVQIPRVDHERLSQVEFNGDLLRLGAGSVKRTAIRRERELWQIVPLHTGRLANQLGDYQTPLVDFEPRVEQNGIVLTGERLPGQTILELLVIRFSRQLVERAAQIDRPAQVFTLVTGAIFPTEEVPMLGIARLAEPQSALHHLELGGIPDL